MIRSVAFGTIVFLAGLALAADAGKDTVGAAAKKLADASSYSWKTTTEMGGNSQFRPGPTEGKTEKGGLTYVTMARGDNTTEIVMQGTKGAVKTDDGWKSLEEMSQDNQQGPGRFMARMVQNFKAPAAQAQDLLGKVQDLKEADGAYVGDLTEEGAKSFMTFGRGGANAPEISGAKGSAKFWVKDGALTKFEYRVQGKMTFNNNERDIDRTTTTEIKDIGSTKIDVPEEAKKKIG
ncbi:MAG: hypothetical protein ACM359_11735 [Bacillota bacterium]